MLIRFQYYTHWCRSIYTTMCMLRTMNSSHKSQICKRMKKFETSERNIVTIFF